MQKGLRTREMILEKAAPMFNKRGFFGTSVDDLVRATGLQKGGLYNHYASKEALATAAFDFAVAQFRARFTEAVQSKDTAVERLIAIAGVMLRSYDDPVVAGGCIVFNTAIESDDAHPALRQKAQEAMRDLLRFVGHHVKLGIKRGELKGDVDARTVTTVIVSTCEGAVALSKLYHDPSHVRRTAAFIDQYVHSLVHSLAKPPQRLAARHAAHGVARDSMHQ